MHDNKEKLMAVGRRVLEASKTELYVAMRFLDLALNSLDYEMDLSIRTVGTDSRSIRYNPSYLIQAYREDSLRVNRLYLHMILHCVFRHMFGGDDKDDKELWDLSCDIAVTSIIDSMDYRCVHEVVPDQRQAVYDRMGVDTEYVSLLGVKVPSLTIPVKPGRNLAVILEVAAMNNRQKKMGYNAATELLDRLGMDMEGTETVKDYDAF